MVCKHSLFGLALRCSEHKSGSKLVYQNNHEDDEGGCQSSGFILPSLKNLHLKPSLLHSLSYQAFHWVEKHTYTLLAIPSPYNLTISFIFSCSWNTKTTFTQCRQNCFGAIMASQFLL